MLPSPLPIYAKKTASPGLKIAESGVTAEESKVFVREMAALILKRRVDGCTAPTGPISVQNMSGHIMHFLVDLYKVAMIFEMCR